MGVESNAKQNLENFSRSILHYHIGMDAETSFLSFQAALEYVFKLSEKERVVLAIDEYPYVARSSKSLASTIQLLIDQYKAASKLMLILCGSSMSYMEDHVLAYKAPALRQTDGTDEILPFDFAETCRYFKNFTAEESAYVYGIVGGIPQYLLQMNDKLSIEDNIKNTFLNPSSALFEEPENLLKQEVREPALYNAIITAIATGASRMSEISGKVGEDTNICSAYIKISSPSALSKRKRPMGKRCPEKQFIRFRTICSAFGIALCRKTIRSSPAAPPIWPTSVSSRICPAIWARCLRRFANSISGSCFFPAKCPVEFSSLGRWWGTDPKEKRQAEIDILAEQDKNTALFGECKWTNEKVDLGVLETLIKRSALFPYKNVLYYLFAKTALQKAALTGRKRWEM